jgi:hypothetical protein
MRGLRRSTVSDRLSVLPAQPRFKRASLMGFGMARKSGGKELDGWYR